MTDATAAKAAIAAVFDRASPTYDQVGVDFFRPVAADLVAAAGLRTGDRVLDVGCGRGANLFAAAEVVGPTGTVTGIDLAAGMVAATGAEARRRGLANVDVRLGDAETPEGPDGSVDAVLAGFIIFFLPDPAAAVRAYRRLLRPGGRLALSTFCQEPADARSLVALVRGVLERFSPPPQEPPRAPEDDPRTRLRTRESLAALLSGGGFVDLRFAERTYVVRFADDDQYWRWLWSAGARAALERIPPDRLDEVRAAVVAAADGVRDADGGLSEPIEVRLTTATAG